jgi:hydrogenase maturation protein HypF
MAGFQMCDRCRAEYDDPSDRRFHAQPNACPDCGPRVALLDRHGAALAADDAALQATAAALRVGSIVAIKGIGGFHLACRADDEQAVATLRARKHREDKPFALMTRSLAEADSLVELDEAGRELISGPQRPIVLAARRPEASIAKAVAPGVVELGVMLSYSPLHHLVLADVGFPLVMTSGNVSDEPIAFVDADAVDRLAGIADLLLVHDRPIQTRTDDSVIRTLHGGRVVLVRRSRGYVPNSIPLPVHASRPILACGAELKNTFCLAKGSRAWVSHHVGDLQNYETLRSFSEGIEHFQRLFAVTPEVVVHDLHPDYLSTRYALEREEARLLGVQHHHAHLAAVLAEHGELGAAVGAIFDGTGYGADGTIWGGELLVGGVTGCERVTHLPPVPMPGGERAIREPWRMACAWLDAISDEDPPPLPGIEQRVWEQMLRLVRSRLSAPQTTSVGRLFDAVAAICGICATVNYEGQAAVELEAACDPGETGAYPITLEDPREGLLALIADVRAGVPVGIVATRFHHGLAAATIEACMSAASSAGVESVVLSGGVWVNRRLLEAVDAGLTAAGLRVLLPQRLPPGDGAISYGQAAIAASVLGDGEEAADPSAANVDRHAGSGR